MDYKDTLNLPRTDFPMRADLVAREPHRLEKWEQARLYQRIQAARAGAEKFVLHDGPPFANGDVHVGNALNKILKDIIVKYKSLRGYDAPYVPGWDCHGLPIEFKVSQEMRKSGAGVAPAGDANFQPAAIRKACEAYARQYIDKQREQFKRLGVLGDWEKPYLTLNKEYEADELRLFADIVAQGFVYRGKKPVYWSIPARTALAEAEVEYRDHVSQSIYVRFPLVGDPGASILIWTTTPWTLPANLAIAYNSTFSYSQVRVGGETFILSTLLLPAVADKCGWTAYEIVRSLDAVQLAQVEFQHPFCPRTGKLFAGDSFVANTTGTGFVHIAPGHGLEDYQLGLEHDLPIYSPVDDDGRFAYADELPADQQMPPELIGKSILEKNGKSEANEAVLQLLRDRKALVHEEGYLHSYPHCWRSKTPVIFRAMDQWFIELDHVPSVAAEVHPQVASAQAEVVKDSGPILTDAATFRERALAAIHHVHWIPDWGKSRIEATVKTRPDWCISRQRAWGVPIPAFYDAQRRPILEPQIVRRAADLIEQHGSNIWFEKPWLELWALLKPKDWKGAEPAAKSNDTLDVWIDSGSSSRAVLMRRPELNSKPGTRDPKLSWQADMYLEGSDQHRGWFQSSLLISLAGNGAAPYRTVLTHGFMVDSDREKISKSKQSPAGYEKPQTADAYVNRWGADILRLWVASQDFRNDISVSEERINTVAETYRVIRNALRYQLSNLYDFDPAEHTVPDEQLTGLDRWILSEFAKLQAEVIRAYDAYEFHVVYQKISQFAAVELSAIYHDVVKDRLYTDPAKSPRRRSTQTALYRMVTGLSQLLAPILSFTADEAWEFVPGKDAQSVHVSDLHSSEFSVPENERQAWKALLKFRGLVLMELEKARQGKMIGKALEARVDWFVEPASRGSAAKILPDLRELLNVSQIEIRAADSKHVASPARLVFNPQTGDPVDASADPLDGVGIAVLRADGRKCERCWHWETDLGSNPDHPTICGRCVAAVNESLTTNGTHEP